MTLNTIGLCIFYLSQKCLFAKDSKNVLNHLDMNNRQQTIFLEDIFPDSLRSINSMQHFKSAFKPACSNYLYDIMSLYSASS